MLPGVSQGSKGLTGLGVIACLTAPLGGLLSDVSGWRMALVLSEDKRFYEHSGVDWRAVSAAAWGNLWNSKTRGASTLTMQLAGLLDEDLQRGRDDKDGKDGRGGRSIPQKIGQTVSAQLLERSWRKEQILEAYLNLVPLRGELVGIDAISRTLFGKAACTSRKTTTTSSRAGCRCARRWAHRLTCLPCARW